MASKPIPLRTAFRACRGELMSAAVFSFFINMLMLTLPLYILQIFSRVLQSQSHETLVMLTVMAVGALIVLGILSAIRSRILTRMSAKLDTLLGEQVHAALISRATQNIEGRDIEGLRDLSQLRNALAGSSIQALFDAPWTPLFLIVMFLLHPVLGFLATAGALILLVMAIINDVATRRPLSSANAAARAGYESATANVRNAEAIDGMGMRAAALGRWRRHNAEMLEFQGLATDRSGGMTAATRSVRLILQVLVFGVGAYLVIDQSLVPGAMLAAILLLGRTLAPVESAIVTWRQLTAARQSYRRLDKLFQSMPPKGAVMRLPRPQGALAVQQVVLIAPAGERRILKGVSFALDPGTSLGIVGPTAAGKSSLAKIMVGVWRPTRGVVRLDGADVATWDPDDLGQYVGYLPQEVELFGGTVRENIARMEDDAPADDVIAAARLAGVHEMILKLPEGYESQIGDEGCVLSGGQRQRIGLARALFGEPRLLVLDEPNANLDTGGEEALLRALAEAKAKGMTTIVIAHRPSILAGMDKLLLLNNGRVEMFGPRAEVMPKVLPQGARPRLLKFAKEGVLPAQ